MKKFEVTIEEIVSQTFEIEAESIENALDIASEKYHKGDLVLEPGNLVQVNAMAKNDEEETNWIEI